MTTFSPPPASTLDEARALTTSGDRLRELASLSHVHRALVAANPAAPAALLRELREHPGLGATLAQNPGVPLDLLWQLAPRHPREVIGNPVLQLVMLARPDLGGIPPSALTALLRSGFLPVEWYHWACDHAVAVGLGGHWVLLVMAREAHTPVDVLRRLGTMQPFLFEALLGNPSLPREVVHRIAALPDPKVQAMVARCRHARPDWLTWKSRARSALVRAAVAGNARTPGRVLARLATDAALEVRAAVARNWFTPREALRHLDGVPDDLLIGNPNLPVERGLELVRGGVRASSLTVGQGDMLLAAMRARDSQRHGNDSVLSKLAEGARPTMLLRAAFALTQTPAALTQLARSKQLDVRRAVARHPSTPGEVLAGLAADRRCEVRREVARHAATPTAVRAWLADDPVKAVRRAAQRER